jgi:ABC-type transport system involved in cytochrome bd biosynthesis fused ATPase/permease subunit
MRRLARGLNRKPWTWAVLALAAAAFHLAAEVWWKALLIMVGATLLDIVVDAAFLRVEKDAGEVD